MKTKLFFYSGMVCLLLISYDLFRGIQLFNAGVPNGGIHSLSRDENIARCKILAEKYVEGNLYHLSNVHAITGVNLLLGIVSIIALILTLIFIKETPILTKNVLVDKIVIVMLFIAAFVITSLNLFSLM